MPDNKNARWIAGFSPANRENAGLIEKQPAANDADGWQQYRRWINKAPAPSARRVGIDPNLYSWRNYRDWTDEVKRSWRDKDDS